MFANSRQEAEQALEAARQVLEQEWKLRLHPTKTQVVSLDQGFDFLGFRYFRGLLQAPHSSCIRGGSRMR